MESVLHKNMTANEGFTIVEIVVTMAVISVFLIGIIQAYLLVDSQRLRLSQQALASDIAYSNLRKFTNRPSALTSCDSSMDLVANPNATGKLLGDQTNTPTSSTYGFVAEPTSVTQPLGSGAKQTVVALAPAGCANFLTSPVEILSTVTYGNNGVKVQHASFVN